MNDWLEKNQRLIVFVFCSFFVAAILCEFMIHPFEEMKVKHDRHSELLGYLNDLNRYMKQSVGDLNKEIIIIQEKLEDDIGYKVYRKELDGSL